MSFAAYFLFKNDRPATNALRFATAAEADAYANDLLCRWSMPEGYEIRESEDPVNYAWDAEAFRAVSLAKN